MNILTVGDIVGNCGVNKLKAEIQDIKRSHQQLHRPEKRLRNDRLL